MVEFAVGLDGGASLLDDQVWIINLKCLHLAQSVWVQIQLRRVFIIDM